MRFRGPKGSWWKFAVLAPVALALTGCSGAYPESVFNPAGPVAADQLSLITLSFWLMMLVFAVVLALGIYAIVKFRARRGDDRKPTNFNNSPLLEALWIIIPFIIVAVLAYVTVEDNFLISTNPPPQKSLQVDVIGHQFWWEFDYPSLGIVTANELHIPAGEKVNLHLTSADVIHSFWIPRLAGKIDALPGYMNFMWIEASKPGVYPGQCAEFCGTGHADMRMRVIAQTPAAFDAWVNQMKHPTSGNTALEKKGMADFATLTCATCHTIAGTPYTGKVGPNLTGLGLRQGIASDTLTNTPGHLAEWLHDPQAVKPGALMPNLGLSGSDIKALVAYLESLK